MQTGTARNVSQTAHPPQPALETHLAPTLLLLVGVSPVVLTQAALLSPLSPTKPLKHAPQVLATLAQLARFRLAQTAAGAPLQLTLLSTALLMAITPMVASLLPALAASCDRIA
jgi:hypothetical protein